MGDSIIQGEGLMSQIDNSNKKTYTTLTEENIRDMMDTLAGGKLVQPKDPKTGRFIKGEKVRSGGIKPQREYVAFCGTGFKDLFDEAMEDTLKKQRVTVKEYPKFGEDE